MAEDGTIVTGLLNYKPKFRGGKSRRKRTVRKTIRRKQRRTQKKKY